MHFTSGGQVALATDGSHAAALSVESSGVASLYQSDDGGARWTGTAVHVGAAAGTCAQAIPNWYLDATSLWLLRGEPMMALAGQTNAAAFGSCLFGVGSQRTTPELLATANGAFQAMDSLPSADPSGGGLIAEMMSVAASLAVHVESSADGGRTWTMLPPTRGATVLYMATPVTIGGSVTLPLVLAGADRPHLLLLGESAAWPWRREGDHPLPSSVAKFNPLVDTVQFVNAQTGWLMVRNATGLCAKLFETTTGGAGWSARSCAGGALLQATFRSTTAGWGISGTHVYQTIDAGRKWSAACTLKNGTPSCGA